MRTIRNERAKLVDQAQDVLDRAALESRDPSMDGVRQFDELEHEIGSTWLRWDEDGMRAAQAGEGPPVELSRYATGPHWRRVRWALRQVTGDRCERCGTSGHDEPLEGHHRHYETVGREMLDDVEFLCRACHELQPRPIAGRPVQPNWDWRKTYKPYRPTRIRRVTDDER